MNSCRSEQSTVSGRGRILIGCTSKYVRTYTFRLHRLTKNLPNTGCSKAVSEHQDNQSIHARDVRNASYEGNCTLQARRSSPSCHTNSQLHRRRLPYESSNLEDTFTPSSSKWTTFQRCDTSFGEWTPVEARPVGLFPRIRQERKRYSFRFDLPAPEIRLQRRARRPGRKLTRTADARPIRTRRARPDRTLGLASTKAHSEFHSYQFSLVI